MARMISRAMDASSTHGMVRTILPGMTGGWRHRTTLQGIFATAATIPSATTTEATTVIAEGMTTGRTDDRRGWAGPTHIGPARLRVDISTECPPPPSPADLV
jgi:hypothetical protein